MNRKRGFGLMEVLVAALVLGLLIVGLNIMQKGNRESILRVRARDGANVVAQEIIDSISAIGSASVMENKRECPGYGALHDLCRERTYNDSKVKVQYSAVVNVKPATTDPLQVVNDSTDFIRAQSSASSGDVITVEHKLSKQVDVTIKWKFKDSDQSIDVSAIIR